MASAQKEHRQIFPQPGWSEHDPAEIWTNTQEVIAEALAISGLTAADLAAVGIATQMATSAVWDRSGKPLHNALVWQDTRTTEHVAEMTEDGGPDRFRAKTGLPLAPVFSSQLMRWLLNHLPDARGQARSGNLLLGTIDSWLQWNLTGEHVTDVSNASITQLMNLATLDWDPELLEVFGIPRRTLPRIVPSSAIRGIGRGVLDGVPIASSLGDQFGALVGQTCFEPGEAENTYGTAGVLVMNTGTRPVPSASGMWTTAAYKFGDEPARYALLGPVAVAGSLVQWLRDNLKLIRSAGEIETLARSVSDNGGVYIVPAFSGLWAPYFRLDARGVIAGLTQFANTGHIARAALEAVAYQTHDIIRAMEQETGIRVPALRVAGGMTVNELLMQFQSDILNIPVVRPQTLETTSLGVAYAAGLAVDYWRGTDDLARNWAVDRRWEPTMDADRRENLAASWKKAVDRSFGWAT